MEIAQTQAGAVSRAQLLALGLSPRQARRWLDSGHWQQIHSGVYLTYTGPVPDLARVWAAVLSAGPDAVASGLTALWLWRALAELPDPIEISVPHSRRLQAGQGVRIRRSRAVASHLHPTGSPPRVRLEAAALEVADRQDRTEGALDVVLRVIQKRLTTADRLAERLREWPRHRWRTLLSAVLDDAADGVTSALELRYARDVERAHGLPRGLRNLPEGEPGARRYHDVRYRHFRLVVELDGREAHPADEAFRDLHRDNILILRGDRVLRYGWRDVAARPCTVAAQVATALRAAGWPGSPCPCAPECDIDGIG